MTNLTGFTVLSLLFACVFFIVMFGFDAVIPLIWDNLISSTLTLSIYVHHFIIILMLENSFSPSYSAQYYHYSLLLVFLKAHPKKRGKITAALKREKGLSSSIGTNLCFHTEVDIALQCQTFDNIESAPKRANVVHSGGQADIIGSECIWCSLGIDASNHSLTWYSVCPVDSQIFLLKTTRTSQADSKLPSFWVFWYLFLFWRLVTPELRHCFWGASASHIYPYVMKDGPFHNSDCWLLLWLQSTF